MTLTFAEGYLLTFLLVMARAMAFLAIAPPFSSRSVSMRIRGGLAAALALALTPTLADKAPPGDLGSLISAAALQILAGAMLGFVALMLFAAVQASGDLVDLFSMFTMSQMLDPITNHQSGVFGRIQNLVGITLLFTSGGHLLLLRGVLTSFEVVPLQNVNLGTAAQLLADNLGTFFVAAIEIAGPILVVLFIADLALGLVSRAVPSLNVFQLAFPVKTLLTVSLASITVSLLPAAVGLLVERILEDFAPLHRVFGG